MTIELELLVRGVAIGAFLATTLVLLRGPLTLSSVLGALFGLAAAAHTATQIEGWDRLLGPVTILAWPLSVTAAAVLWSFTTQLFDDRRRNPWALAIPPLALLLIGILTTIVSPAWARSLWLVHHALGATLLIHAMTVVWRGLRDDLVEARRRLRGPILAGAALYGLGVTITETLVLFSPTPLPLADLAAWILAALALLAAVTFARPDLALFAPSLPPIPAAESDLMPEEAKLADQLELLMRNERFYRAEDVSIASVAARLGALEYRLRRLINQRLGYRNFAAYLGTWRLSEVKSALTDPTQRGVPIATIALDAGYASLGPFNRAFKLATGVTPSAYRDRAVTPASPNLKSG